MLKRLVGTLLFNASLFAAGLGVARMIFGVAIESPSGHSIPLGSSDLWVPFSIAIVLFAAAAALRPSGPPRPPAPESSDTIGAKSPGGSALGAGLPDLEPRVRPITPLPAPGRTPPRPMP